MIWTFIFVSSCLSNRQDHYKRLQMHTKKTRANEEWKFITGLTKCLNCHLTYYGSTAARQYAKTSSSLWFATLLLHKLTPREHRRLQEVTTLMLIGDY